MPSTVCDCVAHALFIAAVVKLNPNTDYSRMKVKDLKQLLKDRGVDTRDCLEKTDFVSKVQQLAAASA